MTDTPAGAQDSANRRLFRAAAVVLALLVFVPSSERGRGWGPRGYHLIALPGNRFRTAAEWLFTAVGSRPAVQLGLVPGSAVPLDTDAPELIRTPR